MGERRKRGERKEGVLDVQCETRQYAPPASFKKNEGHGGEEVGGSALGNREIPYILLGWAGDRMGGGGEGER